MAKRPKKTKPKSKTKHRASAQIKGSEANPSKEQDQAQTPGQGIEKVIPIGMPVSKEKLKQLKKKSEKPDP